MPSVRIILGQFPVEIGLDEGITRLQALPEPARADHHLVVIGGTSAIHGPGKAIVQAYCDSTNSVVVRTSQERRGRVGFVCIPGSVSDPVYPEGPGVTSIYAGTPYDTIAGRIAVGMDNDLFTPEAAQAAAAAGAQYFVVWPTWNLSTNGRMVRDAVIDRARETGMILAAVFPSTSGPAGIAGASSVVATPDGLVLELPGATECAASVTVAVPIVTAVHPGLAAVC